MIERSDLFQSIFENRLHETEVKLDIAGTEYGHDSIVSAAITGGMFDTPGIGGAAARQLDIEIYPIGTIPRQAKICVYVRLTLGAQASEWIPNGVFFISTRQKNKITGVLSITAYDAMLKAEETWLNSEYDTENWPMPQEEAAADIAARMGVELDERTVLDESFPVAYPVDENGDLTMREVLGYMAVASKGNWIITNEGKLLLRRWGDGPAETNYLVTEHGYAILIGGDRILV